MTTTAGGPDRRERVRRVGWSDVIEPGVAPCGCRTKFLLTRVDGEAVANNRIRRVDLRRGIVTCYVLDADGRAMLDRLRSDVVTEPVVGSVQVSCTNCGAEWSSR